MVMSKISGRGNRICPIKLSKENNLSLISFGYNCLWGRHGTYKGIDSYRRLRL